MENPVIHIPSPVLCSGEIIQYRDDYNYYMVKISDSPMGALSGAIACSLVYSPGAKSNYKKGDKVQVLIMFMFGGVQMTYEGVKTSARHYILGLLDKSTMFSITPTKPLLKEEKDMSFSNETNDAGILATAAGALISFTRGAIKTIKKPFGHGVYENVRMDHYQNYHRIISHNEPYMTKEYFGLWKGKNQDDKSTRMSPDKSYICYKRFVTQTMDPSSWVSTCEGTWNPWVGANNDNDQIKKGSEILYTKIINSGKTPVSKRITIEAGEEGKKFYNFRIDKMILGERAIPVVGGATPAISGNTFKLNISEDGEVDLRAASKGLPIANFSGLQIKVDKTGNLTIYAKGKITIGHSDVDKATCGLEFDGKGGINITALGGVKVNGEPIVSATFIKFMVQHAADMFLSSAPGAPSPMNPAVLPLFLKGASIPATTDPKVGGFITSGLIVAPPITGIQPDPDYHATSA